MWIITTNLLFFILGFYLFCLSFAHFVLYKPSLELLRSLKSVSSASVFAVLGIIIFTCIYKVKLPQKWIYPAYLAIFFSFACIGIAIMISSI
ncbi:hypothetical protein [Bacillus weihaiensis]|uniref:Uncharacterized protein n=1 Tax=Bacillus weihaiensis TaxID=1547283 RepID=A0A1L3MSK8_9BACI|nr:hypothetical protein [Bacillus weihaiensis]APH05319.1 hypothetical protein A9C19_11460 [Bacillus weihaiensis]